MSCRPRGGTLETQKAIGTRGKNRDICGHLDGFISWSLTDRAQTDCVLKKWQRKNGSARKNTLMREKIECEFIVINSSVLNKAEGFAHYYPDILFTKRG